MAFLLSIATTDAQPQLGRKLWLQVCHMRVTLFWVSRGSKDIMRISLVTVYKALEGFIPSLQFVENKRGLPSYQDTP